MRGAIRSAVGLLPECPFVRGLSAQRHWVPLPGCWRVLGPDCCVRGVQARRALWRRRMR